MGFLHMDLTHFTPVNLLLQHCVMQGGPCSHISVSQVISDDVPAESTVVVERPTEHDMSCSRETVGQLIGVAWLA